MKTKTKVEAFTLSEVLIVLVITSIVIAIAFSVLRLVTKQYNAINTRYQERTEVLKLKQRITSDMDISNNTFWDASKEQLLLVNKKEDSEVIIYEFYNNILIRDNDTLSKTVNNISFFYQGNPVENGVIDALEVVIDNDENVSNFFVSTRLSASQKINEVWD